MSARLRHFIAVVLAILALSWAATAAAHHMPPVIFGDTGRLTLGADVDLLADPEGRLDLAGARAAYAARRSEHLGAEAPGLGFRPGAVWLRFAVTNPGPRLEERWLWLNWPLTQSAQLWLVGPDGQAEQFDNGARVPLRERPIASRQLLFPIVLGPGETRTAYLRLSSRTSLFVDLSLWQPAAYADAREIRMALRFFIGGATAIVIVYSVLAWRARRRPALLGAAAAQLCLLAVGMTLDGLPGDWMLGGDGLRPGEVVNSLAFLLLAADAFFAREFLRLTEGHPRLDRGVRGVAWLSLPLAAVPFFWSAFNLISAVWLAGIVFLTVVVAFAAVRGDAVARAYLAGWGLLWLGIIVRELGVFGWLGGLPFVSDLPLLGVYASAFAVSYALHLDLSRARAEADVASRRLLEQRESEAERLQRAVETGTRALRQAADRAQAASRAKSAFLSTVSHELRTPLHTILGYTRMLLGSQKDADARAKLALVERGGRSLLGLVDELLEFSHGDHITAELQLEPLSLPGLLADLEQSSRLLAAERGNRLLVSLGDGLPDVVRADERKLTRALQNLVGNACKFTENGTIGVSVEAEAGAPGGEPWRGLRFSVEDTGIGIAPEDRERVFDPFARASTALGRPGIGLGLAIAQQLVRAMGGEITVESAPGQGSRFSFALRLQVAGGRVPAAAPARAPPIVWHRGPLRRILVVEDSEDNRRYLVDLLSGWGLEVREAADGAEALARCREVGQRPDAVLVDRLMPVMDGWAFLRAVRESHDLASLPVALVSAAPADPPAGFPDACRFDQAFLKPLDPDALAEWLRQRLGLEWVRGDPAEPGPNLRLPIVFPDRERLGDFEAMMALGRIVALRRWADELARTDPRLEAFAGRVAALCRSADLKGLQRLLDEARGSVASPPAG